MLWIDAVTIPVPEPAAAAAALARAHGLVADPELDGWTVPLGGAYLELVPGGGPCRWSVATDSPLPAAAVTERRHGTSVDVHRTTEPGLPELVRWANPRRSPGRRRSHHLHPPLGIRYLEVAADAAALRAWLGGQVDDLPLRLCTGLPGVRAVALTTTGGPIVLDEVLTMGSVQ